MRNNANKIRIKTRECLLSFKQAAFSGTQSRITMTVYQKFPSEVSSFNSKFQVCATPQLRTSIFSKAKDHPSNYTDPKEDNEYRRVNQLASK